MVLKKVGCCPRKLGQAFVSQERDQTALSRGFQQLLCKA